MQAHNQPISSSWTVHAWHTLCAFYLRSHGDYVRLYESMHLSLGAPLQRCRQTLARHTHPTHPHTCNTHERSINACVPHSLHSSLHILYEIQLRLYEILRDSAPVCGGSAQGNRRFGSTNHPGETHPYSLIIYIFLIAFPSSMQYFQKRMFLSILFFRVYC